MRASNVRRNAAVILFITLSGSGAIARAQKPDSTSAAARQLAEILTLVEKNYVLSSDSMTRVLRDKLITSLDPYSRFLDSATYAQANETLAGSFGGIGVFLDWDTLASTIRIRAPLKGSPAIEAGIRPSDLLVAVDDKQVGRNTLWDVMTWLKGPIGSKVDITVRRSGAPTDLHLSVKRAAIPISSVRGWHRQTSGRWDYLADLANRVGYIRIDHFASTTPAEFDSALAAVRRAGATSLVLDLRENGGGLTSASIAIADRFLDSGTIVTMKDSGRDSVFRATPGVSTTLPLAILMNEHSASASELLAASLQDNHRGVVIGTRSYGKGRGQNFFPLADGKTALRLTTFLITRPSGRPLDRHIADSDSTLGGVWPDADMSVPVTGAEYERWLDGFLALDDSRQLADGYGGSPAAFADRVLEYAVSKLKRPKANETPAARR